jgi:rfaE bifunctional protein nucleotidyltransferase chain/domain
LEELAHPQLRGNLTTYRQKKILDFQDLSRLKERHSSSKILLCHGVFDVIHAGHLAYFESAKKMGDILVVTITADPFVNKGPGRPYFSSHIRTNMLAALEVIDYVAVSHFPTAVPAIEALKPHLYVKGPDYKDKATDLTGGIYDEERAVERGGGKLAFTEDDTFSSSSLINGFFKIWNEEQQTAIDKIRKTGGLFAVEEVLEKLSRERVRVIGEPIVDSYVFCAPESISSKSPSISARHVYEEDYAGGSLAIANHLSDFVK